MPGLMAASQNLQKAKWDSYLKWGIEYDCPIFHGLFKFCRQYAAASIGAWANGGAGLPCSGGVWGPGEAELQASSAGSTQRPASVHVGRDALRCACSGDHSVLPPAVPARAETLAWQTHGVSVRASNTRPAAVANCCPGPAS